jgi:uncharacterized protein YnzC (UPF0291/DUF896 family)
MTNVQWQELIKAYKDKKVTAQELQNAIEAEAEYIRSLKARLVSRLEEVNELLYSDNKKV